MRLKIVNSKLFIYNKSSLLIIVLLNSLSLIGCRQLISIDYQSNRIDGENVFSLDETAIAAVTNIYSQISKDNHNSFSSSAQLTNISLYSGLYSDEVSLYDLNNEFLNQFYTNSLLASRDIGIWSYDYKIIFAANSAIEKLTDNTKLTINVQRQLLGEAKFIRALCYFYLVNLYGDVPLVLSTDPLVNSLLPRSDIEKVYNQIIDDLKIAKELLSDSFLAGNLSANTNERVRPTKWAASALLSRVYLFTDNYQNSELEASLVINSGYFKLDSLKDVFLINSNESILQFQAVDPRSANTGDGLVFLLPETGPSTSGYPVYLNPAIVASFEEDDMRKFYWTDSVFSENTVFYFPAKYRSGASNEMNEPTEYLMVMRLAEQYLIRAESRIQNGRLEEGLEDLNIIRSRAGLPALHINSKQELLDAVMQERKVELFTEWGNRWLDLKRTDLVDEVMKKVSINKGLVWSSYLKLFPIPEYDLQTNPNLRQNPNY